MKKLFKKKTTEFLSISNCEKERFPIVLVVNNVRSLYNVGAFFRSSEAGNISKIFLCGLTGYPRLDCDGRAEWISERADKQIRKSALGAVDTMSWEYNESAEIAVKKLKKAGYQIAAVEQTEESSFLEKVKFNFPLCLIVGHEREGVEDNLLNLADIAVEIPIFGKVNSLNVSNAYSIVLNEAVRQFRNIK